MFKLNQSFNQYKGLPKEIYILFVGRIINCLGSFVGPLMALILTQKFGMSSSESGSFIALQSCVQGVALIIGGKFVDSFGRKRVIIICQSLGAFMLILCGIMPISMLTAKMMITSSCLYSIAFTAYDALQADVTNNQNRKISYSLLYMGINIGFALGPIIGGFLYKNYLSLVFIGDAVTTLVSMILVVTLIKEKHEAVNIKEREEDDELLERNELEDNVEGSVFKVLFNRPILIVFGIIMFFINFTYAQWPFALPLQLGKIFGSDGAKIYGLLGAANGIIVIIGTPFLMRLTRKFSELMNICLCAFIYFISFLMFGFISSIPLFFFGVILMTLGEIIGATNSAAFISNNSPASHRGRLSSVLSIITGSGFAISPMVIGSIIDNYGMIQGYAFTAISAMGAMILAAIADKIVKNQNCVKNSTVV
ncbi:MFS transporter [Clostridium sp.]|uniref:MFS transporter n=1 Tax=Clostridium sp. TaxID=1506 RepID=UPI002848768E|nr:MFS transporter [Clostridium sp.]MDR3593516.1 MFS transporter [Clostridium sp.]